MHQKLSLLFTRNIAFTPSYYTVLFSGHCRGHKIRLKPTNLATDIVAANPKGTVRLSVDHRGFNVTELIPRTLIKQRKALAVPGPSTKAVFHCGLFAGRLFLFAPIDLTPRLYAPLTKLEPEKRDLEPRANPATGASKSLRFYYLRLSIFPFNRLAVICLELQRQTYRFVSFRFVSSIVDDTGDL